METAQKTVLEAQFTLGITQRATFKEGLDVVVEDIVFEDIAADPEESYPAGSGVTVKLVLKKGDDNIKMSLSKLSKGYKSKTQEVWKGYAVSLLDVIQKSGKHVGWDSYAILKVSLARG